MASVTVADVIAGKVREAIANALHDVEPELEKVAKEGGDAAAHGLVGDIGALSKIITDFALVALVLDPPVGLGLEALRESEKQGGKWAIGSALGYMMGYTAFSMLNPLFMPAQHAIAHTFQNQIHDPQTAADLVARGLMHADHGSQEAKGSAIDQPHFDQLIALATTHPELTLLLELWRRGEVDESFVTTTLTRLGYSGDAISHLTALRQALLSPADLALAQLRGNITRQEMLDYGAKLGVNAADMDLLTENTGEPPGPEQLLEAYRRGFIDESRLERGIRQSRIRNEWIPTVEALRFSPMSVADAIRAVVENYLTSDEGKAIAEQNGLLPEHWPVMVESWGRPLAHGEMLSLYHRGLASRAQVDQAFRESDQKDKYVGMSFDLGRRLIPERLIVTAVHYGAVTMKDAMVHLLQLGYDQADAELLMEVGLHEQRGTHKELTRTQIVELYQGTVIDRKQAEDMLDKLGYSAGDVALMLALADQKAAAMTLRQTQSVVRQSYLAGRLSEQDAANQLVAAGMHAVQADALIQRWSKQHGRGARALTEPQILRAIETGAIDSNRALAELEALGYTKLDATILLQSHGVKP